MSGLTHTSIKSLITKITQYAKAQIDDKKQLALFSQFARLFYSQAFDHDLKKRSISELFGMAYSHWCLVSRAPKAGCLVRVFNTDIERDGWMTSHTVVQINMKDLPFIVDSTRMEINRLGLTVHLMVYMGGMNVCRDKKGKVTAVNAYHAVDTPCANIESPVYMEIDRQTDPGFLAELEENLHRVLDDVQLVVEDWDPMQGRVSDSIQELKELKTTLPAEETEESIAFLQWLLDGQFTFLGAREYELSGEGESLALCLVSGSGLGVLRDETTSKTTRYFSDMPEAAREMVLSSKELLVISKTNTISTVHRSAYTDYIGIKKFDAQGKLIGERRIIGLYTSTAYSSNPKAIPFLRHKVTYVMEKSRLPAKSHAGKDLMHILETFPRDDLFQASSEVLFRIAMGILNLQDRHQTSIFAREDVYNRYISFLVFVPRDNFNSKLIKRIQVLLLKAVDGIESHYATYFYTPTLTRIHYNIRVHSKKKLRYNLAELETALAQVTKSWQDGFAEAALSYFGEERGNFIVHKYRDAFSAAYCDEFPPVHALSDIEHIETLTTVDALAMSLYRPEGCSTSELKFKLFRYGQTVPLSDALPILECMGLRVMAEQPYQLVFHDSRQLWINDFMVRCTKDCGIDIDVVRDIFQETFYRVWLDEAENDLLNSLVLYAQLNWREIAMLRAYIRYLRQTGFTYSVQYISQTFLKYPGIAQSLVEFFHRCFDPEQQSADISPVTLETFLLERIEEVELLDEDRIFKTMLSVMKGTLRVNFYQRNTSDELPINLSFKLSPEKIPILPLPLPKFEIFVYSPRFEGVHLRMGKVARGGLRWSDRREDFRTEVLGLMKSQKVKNAIIVPAGAKGGFVPKRLPVHGTREAILHEAIACYKGFIQGLLDVTDNLNGLDIVHPKNTVCYDDADPYFVVAADKGTATFSDIANQIAVKNDFWLGDAFASGGSTGYDHKKMGITARGAWVAVERHFQGLGVNVNHTDITVVGIGDLSGDVFGNGVLLSPCLKLVAAFNHMHIFIDPNPDTKRSFKERKRMFALPRSAWSDYKTECISAGGGIFSRYAKSIKISSEMKVMLDITDDQLSPNELVTAILKAPVDLLWNGGIGTYVKATEETNADAGDRANDSVRINGADLRARAVAEGGNLGLTQLGRVEFALSGGLINTDFIDNAAGVDCSDHEVNIKILLNAIVESGDLTEKQRNSLLASMTDEVASMVLQNNYHQNQVVSFLSYLSPLHLNLYMRYLKTQEQAGKINRVLEYLPDTKTLQERRANDQGLMRPEIAVLVSYSKIILKEAMLKSDLMDDPALQFYMKHAFPTALYRKYSDYIYKHRLRHEILATQLSNHIVTHMGVTFAYQIMDETGASVSAMTRAFIVAFNIFHVESIYAEIEALDYGVEMTVQYEMLEVVMRLVRRATRWLLRHCRDTIDIPVQTANFESFVKGLYKRLPNLLLGSDKEQMEAKKESLMQAAVPEALATRIASLRSMYHALNIIEVANAQSAAVYSVAHVYFQLVDHLDLHWFREKINAHPVTHRWSLLAKTAFKSDLDWIQRELTASVIRETAAKSMTRRITVWLQHHEALVARWQSILTDLRNEDVADFSIISVGLRELFDLAQAAGQES